MDGFKFVEQIAGVPIIVNESNETVFLSDVFEDLYGQEEGKITHGLEESQIAEKYDLTESQVLEAQNFFRTDKADYLWDGIDDLSYSGNFAIEQVEDAFYGLAAKHDDLDVEVEEKPDGAEVEYRLHLEDYTLQAAVKGTHAYLRSDEGQDVTLRVGEDRIGDEIRRLYNSMRIES